MVHQYPPCSCRRRTCETVCVHALATATEISCPSPMQAHMHWPEFRTVGVHVVYVGQCLPRNRLVESACVYALASLGEICCPCYCQFIHTYNVSNRYPGAAPCACKHMQWGTVKHRKRSLAL